MYGLIQSVWAHADDFKVQVAMRLKQIGTHPVFLLTRMAQDFLPLLRTELARVVYTPVAQAP